MINYLTYIIIFLLGLCLGSFLNVVIYRLPKGEGIVVKPSHCPKCEKKIKPYDLIPLFSYIFLRGKCRYCGEKISIQYPLVELLTALSLVGIYYKFGLSFETILLTILTLMFIATFVIDLFHYIIPNEIIIFGLASGLLLAVVKGFIFTQDGAYNYGVLKDAGFGLLLGMGVFFLIVIIGELIMKAEAMGMGDVKLMGVVGLFLGVKLTVLSMFLAFIIGSIISVFLLATKLKGRKDQIPFGPFIVLGSTIAFLWGNQIINWYFNLGKF